nr:MAG TPA: hypothetical protein [Caudoviricetes sp.]
MLSLLFILPCDRWHIPACCLLACWLVQYVWHKPS